MADGKTVFLTGATGFLGSNLAYALFRNGCRLKLLVRSGKDVAEEHLKKSLEYLFNSSAEYEEFQGNAEVIQGDLGRPDLGIKPDTLSRLRASVGTVIHCAALTGFSETREQLEKQNVEATRNILGFVRALDRPDFHYVSSAYVCGLSGGTFSESDLDRGQSFRNAYEESKFRAELLIREYRDRYGIEPVIYRPSIVVGDSRDGKAASFKGVYGFIKAVYFLVDMFAKDLAKGSGRATSAGVAYREGRLHIPLRIPADPAKTLNIIPVDYFVSVVLTAVIGRDARGRTFHVVNPSPPTIGELNEGLCSLFGVTGLTLVGPDEFRRREMAPWEKFFMESIADLSPYLQGGEPVFSDGNTRSLMGQDGMKCPPLTGELLSRLVSFYRSSVKIK